MDRSCQPAAAYSRVMSDLQCPATFLLVSCADSGPGETGRRQVAELVDRLRDRRVAAVYSGGTAPGVAAAALLGESLGVAARTVGGLQPLPVGPGDGDVPVPTAVARYRTALEDLADLHRGETVLLVDDGEVLSVALWPLDRRVRGEVAVPRGLSPYRPVTLQVDGDGWRLLDGPGGG
jgi:probable phosphoglycerate mutase